MSIPSDGQGNEKQGAMRGYLKEAWKQILDAQGAVVRGFVVRTVSKVLALVSTSHGDISLQVQHKQRAFVIIINFFAFLCEPTTVSDLG